MGRALVVAACAGACTGLADVARALVSQRELLQAHDALDVVAFYAACFAPFGIVAAIVARFFDLPRRALHLMVAFGAAFFFFGAWMNVTVLPGFTSGLSIGADVVLLLVTALWFRARYRDTALDGMPLGKWFAAGLASVAVAFAIAELVPSRDDGPAPQAAAAPGGRRPNVLLYLCDTLRADHLGCYGYEKPTSAEVDAFAKDATLFSDCRAVTSWTKPSVASLFTSLYPSVHGCVEQREVLAPEAETLAEVFRAAGWRTAAFVDNPFISPEFGFGQGFDEYRYVRPSVVANGTLLGKALFMTRLLSLVGKPFGVGEHVESGCESLHAGLLSQFGKAGGAPWFAYVHAMEPHLPYEPSRADAEAMGIPAGTPHLTPPPYNGILPFQTTPDPPAGTTERLVQQYDAEIRGFSRGFGALLDDLGRRGILEDTIVVLVADHGEEFHEHGGWTHGHSLHREVTQVPLIVRLPGSFGEAARVSRGRRVGGVATLLDVMPTLLDLCSIRHPRGAERGSGASLLPQLVAEGHRVEPTVDERVLFGEVTMSPVGIRSIREGRWQLIVAQEPLAERAALYDDVSDPRHRRSQLADHPLEAPPLRARLDEAFRLFPKAALSRGEREIDAETEERLRKLGYVGGK